MERRMFYSGVISEREGGLCVVGGKCQHCGAVSYPQKEMCHQCASESIIEIPLSPKGKLYSYTTTTRPVSNFTPPVVLGYVDLPEGVRMFGPLDLDADTELEIGMELEINICELWKEPDANGDDVSVIGYRFKAVNQLEPGGIRL